MNGTGRVVVHFSCGAASAVAAKIACERYRGEKQVEVIYCDLSRDEHPDNVRFRRDVEQWIGQPVKVLTHKKYRSVEEVWRGERYIVGVLGASCTRVLKREIRRSFQRPDDVHVFGFTADERSRILDIEAYEPSMAFLWLLADVGITKEDCYHILSSAGIEIPVMYRFGYNHNNCIGCCKGGKGYWNKVRRDFPEIFASRARVQRDLGVGFRSGGEVFFLDELDPNAGLGVPTPPIECGVFCGHYSTLVDVAISALSVSSTVNSPPGGPLEGRANANVSSDTSGEGSAG